MSIGLERLKGRVVLVTGAASGIGLATATALVDAGARVHATDFRAPLAEERLGAHRFATGMLAVHQLDVTDPAAVEALVDRIGEEAPLDALVCCAGTNIPDRHMEQLTDAGWRLLLETNLTGVFSCFRAAMPQLRRTRGHAVVVSSVSALWPDAAGDAGAVPTAGGRRSDDHLRSQPSRAGVRGRTERAAQRTTGARQDLMVEIETGLSLKARMSAVIQG
jgi:NAD(P)-dependent dehydrogenase (short-subunit alcohol dehydrogenase family)